MRSRTFLKISEYVKVLWQSFPQEFSEAQQINSHSNTAAVSNQENKEIFSNFPFCSIDSTIFNQFFIQEMFKARIKVQDDEGNWLVPNEVLIHILKFVPDRRAVAMSCRKLYELVCLIEKNNRQLRINSDLVR